MRFTISGFGHVGEHFAPTTTFSDSLPLAWKQFFVGPSCWSDASFTEGSPYSGKSQPGRSIITPATYQFHEVKARRQYCHFNFFQKVVEDALQILQRFRNAGYCQQQSPRPHVLDELRRLFKLVHPDLFHSYPQHQEINQRSFQLLQEYLRVAKGGQVNCSVNEYKLEFYVRREREPKGFKDEKEESIKKVEVCLPPPQATLPGTEMLPATRSALGLLLSSFGLSPEFSGNLTGGGEILSKSRLTMKLSELFQTASELQRQNETTVLGQEQRMIVVRNALRLGRGVTVSFRKDLPPDSQLQCLHSLARALDSVPDCELKGCALLIGDSCCGVDGLGNLWLNHDDGPVFWAEFFRQLDVSSIAAKRAAVRERRVKEFRAARLMEVEMIFADDALSLEQEYSSFLDKVLHEAEAIGAVGDGKFHDLPIRVTSSSGSSMSVDDRMGYINVPVTENLAEIYKFVNERGREAVKRRIEFKAEEEKLGNLNLHVRKKLRLRNLVIPWAVPWRGISTNRVLGVSGTKKGKIVEAAKKSGYKKGGAGAGKKLGKKGVESKNVKDAGVGATIRVQVQSKRKTIEPKIKISDGERQTMLAELNRLAKETSRILMNEHREKQWSEGRMLAAKVAAIGALPDHLRAGIKTPVMGMRKTALKAVPPTILPPIGGYAVDTAASLKAAVVKKRR
ncbi:hypothetical protein SELMODRAFT_439009 [Selaginella moellendorffii]|uniref:DUF4460 domain-containing protein n=1 Tax=Selaginella moellendorffii TaxID=88036 RepID=D8R1Q2_SELML|nr:hypothetical protein SELMODRAFT_439009 [Selaginella moellendorffii]